MGIGARHRVFRRRVHRRQYRRRSGRSARFLRHGSGVAGDFALHRIGQGRAQVHVGGARRRPRQTGAGRQIRAPRPGRQGGDDPYRRAGRIGCRLRRRVPSRRFAAGARSRRIVRRRGNARSFDEPCRQASCDLDQRRRDRRARGRSSRGFRRRTCGHFARDDDKARCGAAADLVARQSGRHCRRRGRTKIRRGARAIARRYRQRCRSGHERADRAGIAGRGGEVGHCRDRAPPPDAQSGKTGVRGLDRRRRSRRGSFRCRGHSELRDRSRRGRRLHASGAIPGIARAADGDAAQHAAGFCAGSGRGAPGHRRRSGRQARLARSSRNNDGVFGLWDCDHAGEPGAQCGGSRCGGTAPPCRGQFRRPRRFRRPTSCTNPKSAACG